MQFCNTPRKKRKNLYGVPKRRKRERNVNAQLLCGNERKKSKERGGQNGLTATGRDGWTGKKNPKQNKKTRCEF